MRESRTVTSITSLLSDESVYSSVYKVICAFLVAVTLCRLAHGWLYMYVTFPNGYEWSEVFIKWTDDYVRRGLLGWVLYHLTALTSADFLKWFWISCTAILEFSIFFLTVRYIKDACGKLFFLIILFGPAYFAFPISCYAIPGRKDLLILLLVLLMYWIIWKRKELFRDEKYYFAALLLLFSVATLIHEFGLFFGFFPLFIAAVLQKKSLFKNIYMYSVAIVTLILIILTQTHFGSFVMRDQMIADWQSLIPDYVTKNRNLGINYVGVKSNDFYRGSLPFLYSGKFINQYILGWLLALIPLFIYGMSSQVYTKASLLFGRTATFLLAVGHMLLPVCLTFLMNDYGRIIAYNSIVMLLSSMLTVKLSKVPDEEPMITLPLRYAALGLVLVYVLLWRMNHFPQAGMQLVYLGGLDYPFLYGAIAEN